MRNLTFVGSLSLLLAGCGPAAPDASNQAGPLGAELPAEPVRNLDNATAELPPVEPAAPGAPGGLPDDRSPISEAPFAETSAQGAANVVQIYFALAETKRWDEAVRSWGDRAAAQAFSARFRGYGEFHAQVGGPGEPEGAAGSIYVTVPVQLYGRTGSGAAFRERGTMTLRRVNDVPGSTPEQRRWHIERYEAGSGDGR